MKRKSVLSGLVALLVTTLSFAGVAAKAADVWDLSTEFNERFIFGKGYIRFAEEVEKRTNGEIKVVPHFGAALGYKSADHLELVGQGAVPIADTYSGALSGVDPIFKLSSLPFVATSIDDAWELYLAAKPYYESFFAKNGQVLLYTSFSPPSGLWAKKPVASVEDMAGLRIRTYDPAGNETMRNIGAAPIQMNITDVIPQLASGGISGVLTSAEGAVSFKFYEFLDHFTEINYAVPLQFLHMNKAIFDGLPAETKQAITEISAEVEAMNWQAGRDGKEEAYSVMRENGMTINTQPPQEFLDALQEAGEPVVTEWLETVGAEGEAILADYKERIGTN